MAPLSFFKSDKSSSSAGPSNSNSNNNNNTNNNVPDQSQNPNLPESRGKSPTPPPPPPSSFTSRLLRRKPSSKVASAKTSTEVESPPGSSTSATFDLTEPPFEGSDDGPGPQHREREPMRSPNRKAWVYGRHSGVMEGKGDVVVNPETSEVEDGHGLGDLFTSNSRKYNAPPSPGSTSSGDRPGRNGSVSLSTAPLYPTALSPPRRPMPKSTPSSSSTSDFPISSSMLPSISAVNGPALSPSLFTRQPSANAEWLARKPSGRRSASSSSTHNPLNLRLESPRKSLGGAVNLRSPTSMRSLRTRTTSSSTAGEADASSSADSEGDDIGSSGRVGNGLGYEVAVVCTDERDELGEITWQVKIRPRVDSPTLGEGYNSAIPLNLSISPSTAFSPPAASSINLSLSLDQPTGKLVFIAFPMDIHATPRHRPTPQNSSYVLSPPLRPSTPPPSAPRLNGSPPPSTPSSKRGANPSSMWPSPSTHGRSPSAGNSMVSPSRERTSTPRRSRLMNAEELNGGLYARGTVDGMSEEFETSMNLHNRLGEALR
jgi:hypothetical protein